MITYLQGSYCDVVTDSQGRVRWSSGWRSNLIVHDCSVLLAALLKRHRGMRGILFWAVGEGEKEWDALCPSPHPADTQLHKEIARQKLSPAQVVYLDDAGLPKKAPTDCLQITTRFKGENLVANGFQPLREFGLFGGNATEEVDSGYMIDYVIHPRIDLAPGDTLERKLHLSFAAGTVRQEEALIRFGANLPVGSIDGVGDVYTRALNEHGIHCLGDLAAISPVQSIGDIPPAKLREFRAKARLVMRLQVGSASLAPFAGRSVSRFLMTRAENLTRPGMAPEKVGRLQEALTDLQVALDEAQLRDITLGELVNA
jgi:hypothetical protein